MRFANYRGGQGSDSQGFAEGRSKSQLLLVGLLCALCLGPTFISYQPYYFQWDDSDYFSRAIAVSLAFWSGNWHELVSRMVSQHPPAMALMGMLWGPLRTWPEAGDCFVTLCAVISLLVALSIYLTLRAGVKLLYLALACVCVAISLGPYPGGASAHQDATAFMADSLLAWAALVAVLLVVYEDRVRSETTGGSFFRGLLWGVIMCLGTMAKVSFLYFVALIVPTVIWIKVRREGRGRALTAAAAFLFFSMPLVLYLLEWGRISFFLAKSSSFGGMSPFYYSPLPKFLATTVRESPGMVVSLALAVAGITHFGMKGGSKKWWSTLTAIAIVVGFAFIVLVSPNREIRFSFPLIIALPFLAAVAVSGEEYSVARREALICAALVFASLLVASIPTRNRPQWRSFSRSNAVFAQAARLNSVNIILATDSPTLNGQLMSVAGLYTTSPCNIYSLAYSGMSGVPLQDDFRALGMADLVVFQDRAELRPPFTNQRVAEYEQYVRQVGLGPIKVAEDVSVYVVRYRQPADR